MITSYPPAYIVGALLQDSRVVLEKDTEMATVTLEEVSSEYMYSNPQGMFNLSVPDKMWRTPQYTQISYPTYKSAELKQKAEETGAEISVDDVVFRSWQQDKSQASTILKVMAKSKAPRMIRVGIKLSVADNGNKNVNFPLTELKVDLFSNDNKQAFLFVKIDPSKDTWGDIDCEVSVKQGKTAQISSGAGYTSGGYSTSTGTGTGSGGIGIDKPQSYGTTVKIRCPHCNVFVFESDLNCEACGKDIPSANSFDFM